MTDISTAVAERVATPSPLQQVTAAIAGQYELFGAVMPDGLNRDRFNNLVVSLVRRTPDLVQCVATREGRTSLILAVLQCASLGLEPNSPLREASIVPRKNKGRQEAQLMIEYRGLIKLARRSGELSTIRAEVVHERDDFAYELGLTPSLRHIPYDGDDDPGPLTHCYAVAVFKDGGSQFIVAPRRVVHNEHRAKSDSWRNERSRPFSPWTEFEASMWRKTAVRCLEPFLPLTADAQRAMVASEPVSLRINEGEIEAFGSLTAGDDDVVETTAGDPEAE